jgi:hypothetical protein
VHLLYPFSFCHWHERFDRLELSDSSNPYIFRNAEIISLFSEYMEIVVHLNQLRMVSRIPRLAGFETGAFVLYSWPALEVPIGIPGPFGGCCVIPV